MNKIKILIIIILDLILQSTVIANFSILGVHANLSMPILIGLSIGFGTYIGGYSGLLIGLVEDMYFSKFLGIRSLIYFMIGFLVGNSEAGINKEDVRSGMILTGFSTVIYFIYEYIMLRLLKSPISFWAYIRGPIFLETILNIVLYFIIFHIFKKIFKFPRFRL